MSRWKLSADGLQLACFSFTAAAVCLLNTALATQARSNYLPTFLSWDSEKDAYSSEDGVDLCPTSPGLSCPTILLALDGFLLAYHFDYLNRCCFA